MNSYTQPKLHDAPLPRGHYIVVVDGRPRRPEVYPTQAAAQKAANSLARYAVGCRVTVFRAEPIAAVRDPV